MEKKKILKSILIIIIAIIAIFIIHTIKNYIIITGLQNKITQYKDSTNYNIKSTAKEENGTTIKIDYYKKDNKQVIFLERNTGEEVSKISMYDNGERTDTFAETKDTKVAQLNSGTIMNINIYNYLETENKWQTLLGCVASKIKKVNYNDKQCYNIKGFMSSTSLTSEDAETYTASDSNSEHKKKSDSNADAKTEMEAAKKRSRLRSFDAETIITGSGKVNDPYVIISPEDCV